MPSSYSFDVVSDFDRQELVNAIDQLRREVEQRYDLKDSKTEIEIEDDQLSITSSSDMNINSINDILRQKVTRRKLSLKIFDFLEAETIGGNRVKQKILLKRGLSQEIAKKLSKVVRDNLKKVTVSIQGDSLRVTGKNKDDLQLVINLLRKEEEKIDIPLQYQNYR